MIKFIKCKYNNIKYYIRKKIINVVKPTHYEWASMSPFGMFDGMSIVIRYGFNGSKDLELRFGKDGAHWFCGYYANRRKVKRKYISDYFLNNEIKDEFYPFIKEINPAYFIINVSPGYQNQKKIVQFIEKIKKLFPKHHITIKTQENLKMFQ